MIGNTSGDGSEAPAEFVTDGWFAGSLEEGLEGGGVKSSREEGTEAFSSSAVCDWPDGGVALRSVKCASGKERGGASASTESTWLGGGRDLGGVGDESRTGLEVVSTSAVSG